MKPHPTPPPVSYTHLDVYKRQPVHVAVGGRNAAVAHHDGDLVESLRQGSPEIPVVPVSYTHLDVYKRQCYYNYIWNFYFFGS